MIADLNTAKSQSTDHPEADQIEATCTVHINRRNRPKIKIDEDILEELYKYRTVHRCVLEAELAEAWELIYVVFEDADGNSW